MQARVVGRIVAAPSADFVNLGHGRCRNGHACSDRGPVALGTNEAEEDPVIRIYCFINKQRGRLADIEDHNVEVPIIIDVAKSCAPPGLELALVETSGIRNVLKCAASEVAKKLNGLRVTDLARQRIHQE